MMYDDLIEQGKTYGTLEYTGPDNHIELIDSLTNALREITNPVDDAEVQEVLYELAHHSPFGHYSSEAHDLIERLARNAKEWEATVDNCIAREEKLEAEIEQLKSCPKENGNWTCHYKKMVNAKDREIERLKDIMRKANDDIGKTYNEQLKEIGDLEKQRDQLQAAIDRLADDKKQFWHNSSSYGELVERIKYAKQFATKPRVLNSNEESALNKALRDSTTKPEDWGYEDENRKHGFPEIPEDE